MTDLTPEQIGREVIELYRKGIPGSMDADWPLILAREFLSGKSALDAERARNREAYDKGWDDGHADYEQAIVCSVCGFNHDQDESAACEGCEAITLDEYVGKGRERADRIADLEAVAEAARAYAHGRGSHDALLDSLRRLDAGEDTGA